MNRQELYALIDKYLAGEANAEEIDLLSRYYNSFQDNIIWNKTELGPEADARLKIFAGIREKIKSNDEEEVNETVEADLNIPGDSDDNLNVKRKVFTLKRIGVAASIIGLLALVMWFGFRNDLKNKVTKAHPDKHFHNNDVLPGSDKAILQLADGSTIELDDAKNGALAQQGNTKVIKLDGKLNYNASSAPNQLLYNTITTPRGGKYQIQLTDGSQIWLNAASSLRFPTAFKGKERKVEITGEAYFEVAKNKTMPFIVSVNGAEIQVLGTRFNVMAYNEETSVNTTLVEGSVKFVSNHLTNMLAPGQQSQLLEDGQVRVVDGVDLEEVLAWKNGIFHFQGADIGTVMRQLSRWYDVDVVYNKKVDDLFYAEIPRNTTLSDVLQALALTGKVHFEIESGKIIVKQ